MDKTCGTCRWWQMVEVEPFWTGDCRAMPPRMQGDIAPHGSATFQDPKGAVWPTTRESDWCAAFVFHTPKEPPHAG